MKLFIKFSPIISNRIINRFKSSADTGARENQPPTRAILARSRLVLLANLPLKNREAKYLIKSEMSDFEARRREREEKRKKQEEEVNIYIVLIILVLIL